MKKTPLIILGIFLTTGLFSWSQCTLRPEFYSELAHWHENRDVPFYITSVNEPADWQLIANGTTQTLANLPAENDGGTIVTDDTLSFTIRYYENACDSAELIASASSGTLALDSIVQIDTFIFEAHYSFSSSVEGQPHIDLELQDSDSAVISTARLNITVTAPPEFELTVTLGQGVSGSPTSGGLYDPDTLIAYNYSAQTCYGNIQVTLDGNPISASGNITMDDNHDLQVSADLSTYTVNVSSSAGGHTDHDGPNPVTCGDDLSIQAIPSAGNAFSHWTGDASGNDNPLLLNNIQQNYSIQAEFIAVPVNMTIARVEVIQGITMSPAYRVVIANRDTVVRVFVGITGATSQGGVQARMTRYVGSTAMDQIMADNGPRTLSSTPSEGNINDTLNFTLPPSWLAEGTSYVVELDPLNTVLENNENDNRYPATGERDFGYQTVDSLDIVIVPVHYTNGGHSSTPNTADLSYLTWMPEKVYPVHQINYTLHSTHNFNGDLTQSSGWNQLLDDITQIHDSEDSAHHKLYFGLVDFYSVDGCPGGCIAGLGWVSAPTCTGFSGWGPGTVEASETFTHEMGHNFGRYHSPCGSPANVDPNYPYTNASIGTYGLDTSNMQLYSPLTYKDYMSYCDPDWTSDYTYFGIYNFREGHPYKTMASLTKEPAVWFGGIFDLNGSKTFSSHFKQNAPVPASESSGDVRIELLDSQGTVLLSQNTHSNEIADAEDTRGFGVFLPDLKSAVSCRIFYQNRLIHESTPQSEEPDVTIYPQRNLLHGAKEIRWKAKDQSNLRIRVKMHPESQWEVFRLNEGGSSLILEQKNFPRGKLPVQIELQFCRGLKTKTVTLDIQ